MTSSILVTGANGFVGKALCEEALLRGFNTYGATRLKCKLPAGINNVVMGNIDEFTDWQHALVDCDVVIHLAARVHVMNESSQDPLTEFRRMNVFATEQLARISAANGAKRFVYVSSIKVNGEQTYTPQSSHLPARAIKFFNEQDIPAPQDPYGISKWEAEQTLHRVAMETGLEVVIVRPPLVYGPGVKGNFAQMISILKRGIPLPFTSVRNKRSLVYVGNLVDALLLCATHPAAPGQTYLVSDGEGLSTSDLLRKLAVAMGKSPRLFTCPTSLLRWAGRLVGKTDQMGRLLGSLQVDSSKIRRELGWMPPFSVDDGLKASVQDKEY